MTVIINASPTNGLVQTADGSGVLKVQSNGVTTNALAWVNYNASSQTIQASYNVSSVTYNSTGNYTVNFSTAMSNANYVVLGSCDSPGSATSGINTDGQTTTTVAVKFGYWYASAWYQTNRINTSIAVFGN